MPRSSPPSGPAKAGRGVRDAASRASASRAGTGFIVREGRTRRRLRRNGREQDPAAGACLSVRRGQHGCAQAQRRERDRKTSAARGRRMAKRWWPGTGPEGVVPPAFSGRKQPVLTTTYTTLRAVKIRRNTWLTDQSRVQNAGGDFTHIPFHISFCPSLALPSTPSNIAHRRLLQ
jgi:hypothetical protein